MLRYRQAGLFSHFGAALVLLFLLAACAPKANVEPPVDSPLSRELLGYGVVTASYTRLMNEPDLNGVALGIVRERAVLRALERRLVKKDGTPEYWILVEGDYRGWLPESVLILYDNEGKAQTAASREP